MPSDLALMPYTSMVFFSTVALGALLLWPWNWVPLKICNSSPDDVFFYFCVSMFIFYAKEWTVPEVLWSYFLPSYVVDGMGDFMLNYPWKILLFPNEILVQVKKWTALIELSLRNNNTTKNGSPLLIYYLHHMFFLTACQIWQSFLKMQYVQSLKVHFVIEPLRFLNL